jgi:hypothetical protein
MALNASDCLLDRHSKDIFSKHVKLAQKNKAEFNISFVTVNFHQGVRYFGILEAKYLRISYVTIREGRYEGKGKGREEDALRAIHFLSFPVPRLAGNMHNDHRKSDIPGSNSFRGQTP